MASAQEAAAATLSHREDCMQMFTNPPAGAPIQAVKSSLDLSNDLPADNLKQQPVKKQGNGSCKASTITKSSSDCAGSPARGGSKPANNPRTQQPQQSQQRVLDLRTAGHEIQHWAPGAGSNACNQSPVHHIPQRLAWESTVAAVWGKPKPTELKPAGSAGAGGVLDLTGSDHTDTSHWCSVPGKISSNPAAADTAVQTAATADEVENSHWAPSIVKRKSNDGSPQGQQNVSTIASASAADQALCGAPADTVGQASTPAVAVLPGASGAGVKRQLPLGSLIDATAAGAAVVGSWWTLEPPITATAADTVAAETHQTVVGTQAAAAGDQTAEAVAATVAAVKPNSNTSQLVAELQVPASTFKRLKISSAEDDAPTPVDSVDMDCGMLQQHAQAVDAVAAAAVQQKTGAQPDEQDITWATHQREVQQLKQQQEELQQLLQLAEQHVKAPLLREAHLLTMEMQDKVRARGLDSVSLAAISRDVPRIKRTADSDAERVAAHMLAQEGGNWKASLERLMRMVKTSSQQKQLLGLKQDELHPSSSTASPVHSSGGGDAAAAGAAVPEAPMLSQQQQGSALKPQEHGTPITLQWQRSMQDDSPYAAAAGGTALAQASPYAAAVDSAHNSPAVRQHSTAGTLGQPATASPYVTGSFATAHGRSGSPYTAGPVGLAGVPQPAAMTAAKLQWPMVPTSAVGSPVGSPACSPMVPASAVGSPLTASADVNCNAAGSGAAAAGGFSNLILPAPVWGGATTGTAAASGAAATGAAGVPVRYGSPMPTLHEGIASANCSPVGPAAAAGARGRSHSPAGTCGRPKLVRQQSRMAPKQPQNKASVTAMTAGGYPGQASNAAGGVGAAAVVVPSMLGVEGYTALAPAGAAGYMPGAMHGSVYAASAAAVTATPHMQGVACNDVYAAAAEDPYETEAAAAEAVAAANMPGSFDSSAYAAGAVCTGAIDAAAAAAMPVFDGDHSVYGAAAARSAAATGAGAMAASNSSDARVTGAESSLGHGAVAADDAAYAQQSGVALWNAISADVVSSGLQAGQDPAGAAAVTAHNATAAGAKQAAVPSNSGQQQQHLTTAAAAAAAFGSVTALTVDTDIEDAGWLFGEGGLLPDTPGPANLLAAPQQQQGKMHATTHLQQQQHGSSAMLPVMMPAANSAAAAAQPANMAMDRVAETAVTMPPPAAAAVGPGGAGSGAETKPLGTDKDDIALLQMLLGWGSDS